VYKAGSSYLTVDYLGELEFHNNSLKFIHTDEGLARYNETTQTYAYEYFLKDHLGNTRAVVTPDAGGNLSILQASDYYPFGLAHNPLSPNNDNKYLYNGKELQDETLGVTALDWYDYGARFYDPQIGRFTCLDPIASEFPHVTPYNYAENKVINCFDLWGLQAVQVTASARGALPLLGPLGVSASFGMGLIYDFQGNLVLTSNIAFGVSVGAAISVGLNGSYYHTANTYEDLLGLGVDAGFMSSFPINFEGDLSFGDKTRGAISVSGRATAGAAGYADVTFTNLVCNFGNINNATESLINKISSSFKITKQQAKILLEFMKSKLDEEWLKKIAENSILIPEVVIIGKKAEKPKSFQERMEELKWQSVRPNQNGNTGRYNKPGRSTDQFYSDDFLKWYYSDSNNNNEKKN
jgi:RHS repeat-associated protein